MKLLIVVLLLAQAEKPAELTPRMKEIVAMGEKTRETQISDREKDVAQLTKDVANIKDGVVNARLTRPPTNKNLRVFLTQQSKQSALDKAKDQLKTAQEALSELKSRRYVTPLFMLEVMKVGNAGIPSWKLQPGCPAIVEVDQIIDSSNMIVTYGETRIWLNTTTKGLTDGTKIKLETPYDVIGTKTYATAGGGSQTVFQLKAFTMPPESQEAK